MKIYKNIASQFIFIFPNKAHPQANEGHSRLHQDNEYLAALTRCAHNSISH